MQYTEFQRIEKVKNFHKIKSFADFSRILGLKNQQIFTDIKSGKHGISPRLASKIHEIYPDISTLWLITGEGAMLVDCGGDIRDNNVGGDLLGNGATKMSDGEDIKTLVDAVSRLTIVNQKQTEQISELINMLKEK